MFNKNGLIVFSPGISVFNFLAWKENNEKVKKAIVETSANSKIDSREIRRSLQVKPENTRKPMNLPNRIQVICQRRKQ